ncbi:MAG: leucine-rich repeat protein, partial [Lachnospiraceae bacterium]|nr:leucine-rich repeat protein [Lachnospiraceae bacterium]
MKAKGRRRRFLNRFAAGTLAALLAFPSQSGVAFAASGSQEEAAAGEEVVSSYAEAESDVDEAEANETGAGEAYAEDADGGEGEKNTDEIASGSCGKDAAWKLTGSEGDYSLTISGTGKVSADSTYGWSGKMGEITSLKVEEGITSISGICKDAFNLKEVSLPEGLKEIGEETFYGCSSLESVDLPDNVESIGRIAFFSCDKLSSLRLPDSLKYVGPQAFLCRKLPMPSLPEGLETVEYGAFNCMGEDLPDKAAVSLRIPSSVSVIGHDAFSQAFVTEFIVDEGNPYFSSENGCLYDKDKKELKQVPRVHDYSELLLNENTREIESSALIECRVDTLILPEGYSKFESGTLNSTRIKAVFLPVSIEEIGRGNYGQDASGLEDIYYAGTEEQWDAIKIYNSYIGNKNIYLNCTIDNIPPSWQPYKPSAAGKTYSGSCGEDATWTLSGSEEGYALAISGTGEVSTDNTYEWSGKMGEIVSLTVEEGITSISGICKDAFNLKEISLPKGLKEIGEETFYGCSSLESINIPDSVERIGRIAFFNCSSLSTLRLPDSLKYVGLQAFLCRKLPMPSLPEELETIEDSAFSCMGDYLPDEAAVSLKIPSSVSFIGQGAFLQSSVLEFVVDEGNPYFSSENGCLYDKDRKVLRQVPTVHEYSELRLDENTREIEGTALFDCRVDMLVLPEGYSKLADGTLGGTRIKAVFLPVSIEEIEERNFEHAYGLEDIYYAGTEKQWNSINILDPYIINKTIHFNSVLEEIGRISVSFDVGEGVINGNDHMYVTYGEAYRTLPTAERKGYLFGGWFTSEMGGSQIEDETIVKTKENHTLYAYWIEIPEDMSAEVLNIEPENRKAYVSVSEKFYESLRHYEEDEDGHRWLDYEDDLFLVVSTAQMDGDEEYAKVDEGAGYWQGTLENGRLSYHGLYWWGKENGSDGKTAYKYQMNRELQPSTAYSYRLAKREANVLFYLTKPSSFFTLADLTKEELSHLKFGTPVVESGFTYADITIPLSGLTADQMDKSFVGSDVYWSNGNLSSWGSDYGGPWEEISFRLEGLADSGTMRAELLFYADGEEVEVSTPDIPVTIKDSVDAPKIAIEYIPLAGTIGAKIEYYQSEVGFIEYENPSWELVCEDGEEQWEGGTSDIWKSSDGKSGCSLRTFRIYHENEDGKGYYWQYMEAEKAYQCHIELWVGENYYSGGTRKCIYASEPTTVTTLKNKFHNQSEFDPAFLELIKRQVGIELSKNEEDGSLGLYDNDLQSISYLDYSLYDEEDEEDPIILTNLKGIEYLTGLEEVYLPRNYLEDISGIEKLKWLNWLSLWGNCLRTIPDLSGLKGLEVINIRDNFLTEEAKGKLPENAIAWADKQIDDQRREPAFVFAKNKTYYAIGAELPLIVRLEGMLEDEDYAVSVGNDAGKELLLERTSPEENIFYIKDISSLGAEIGKSFNASLKAVDKYDQVLIAEKAALSFKEDSNEAFEFESELYVRDQQKVFTVQNFSGKNLPEDESLHKLVDSAGNQVGTVEKVTVSGNSAVSVDDMPAQPEKDVEVRYQDQFGVLFQLPLVKSLKQYIIRFFNNDFFKGGDYRAVYDNEGTDVTYGNIHLTVSGNGAPASGMSVPRRSVTIRKGEEKPLTAQVLPADGEDAQYVDQTVQWAVRHRAIASVSPASSDKPVTLKGLKEGTTVITARSVTGDYIEDIELTVVPEDSEESKATVTFKVANGSWDDGTADDKTVTLTSYNGDALKLEPGEIPGVGSKPDADYKAGSWDVVPSADAEIKTDTIYTYSYVERLEPKVIKAPTAINPPLEHKVDTENHEIAQDLVTAGEAEGGTMLYASVLAGEKEPDDTEYSEAIPQAAEAGGHDVWYKVKGDSDHKDFKAKKPIRVYIRKRVDGNPKLSLISADAVEKTPVSWAYGSMAAVPFVSWEGINGSELGAVTLAFKDKDGKEDESYSEMPTDVGDYKVQASVADTAKYFGGTTEWVEFTIEKGSHDDVLESTAIKVHRKGVTNGKMDISSYLPKEAGAAWIGVTVPENELITAASLENGILTYTSSACEEGETLKGSVQLQVSTANYENYNLTIPFVTAEAYMLRLDSKGGTAIGDEFLQEGESIYDLLPSTKEVARIGYALEGWYKDSNFSVNKKVAAEDTMLAENTTVYAHWEPVIHTVTLDLGVQSPTEDELKKYNKGEDGNKYSRDYNIRDDVDFELPILSDKKDSDGSVTTFAGWKKDGEEVAQRNVTIIVSELKDVVYTASWVDGKSEGEISFDAGAGTNVTGLAGISSGSLNTEDKEQNDASDAAKKLLDAMKEVAAGEQAEETGNSNVTVSMNVTAVDASDDNLDNLDNDTKAAINEAKKDEKNNYDVLEINVEKTVEPENGGEESKTEPLHDIGRVVEIPLGYNLLGRYLPKVYHYYGGILKPFDRLYTRPKSGFRDGTYYVSGSGISAIIFIYSSSFSPYAISTTDTATYTVLFDSNGGSAVDSKEVSSGDTVKAPNDPIKNAASNVSYAFDGWYTTSDFVTKFDFEQDTVSNDMTLYARWVESYTNKYTITFDANEGTVMPASAETGEDGKLSSLPTPARTGYSFSGWYTEKTGGTQVTSTTVFTGDATVYARWNKNGDSPSAPSGGGGGTGGGAGGGGSTVTNYTVSFSLNGKAGTALESQKVAKDGKATKPADPTAEG